MGAHAYGRRTDGDLVGDLHRVAHFPARGPVGITDARAAARWKCAIGMLPPARSQTPTVHAGGSPPTARQLLRELVDVAAAVPWFASAPLLRGWHRRWGATDA